MLCVTQFVSCSSCHLVQVCLVNCPRFPMYLSPSLCSLCLLGLLRYVCVSPAIHCVDLPCFWIILKTVTLIYFSVVVSDTVRDRRPDRQKKRKFNCVFPSVCFPCFVQCFCFSPMDTLAAKFTALAHKDLPILEYAVEFSQLAVLSAFDDAALNSLFWIWANYHCPVDFPDTTGLNWRDAIIRLESIRPRSRTQPDPEPSPPSPRCAEPKPEPTNDGEPATTEPSPNGLTKLKIAVEPEPQSMSDFPLSAVRLFSQMCP